MLPFVSVLCPTYNRQALLPIVIEQYKIQSYPIERRELIILDDSTDRANLHISDKSINYIHHRTRLKIGKKRNMLLRQAKGEIVVWVDDDDLYNKDRILGSVNVLVSRDDVEVIGVKSTVFYDVNSRRFSRITHTSKNYTCNNIMAHRKSIDCEYADEDTIGEEKVFTSGFQLNAYQFDGLDLCIHMCHSKNTAGKSQFFRRLDQTWDIDKMKNKFCWSLLQRIERILVDKQLKNLFWLNLRKDVARRENMENEFAKVDDFRAIRFEALSPDTLGVDGYTSNNESYKCMSSHIDLMRFASHHDSRKNDVIFIMEDDIVLKTASLQKLEDIIATAPSDWEILQLHHVRLDCRRRKISYDAIVNKFWVPWRKGFYSKAFYAVKSNAVSKIIDMFTDKKSNKFNYKSIEGAVHADEVLFARCKTYTSVHNFVCHNSQTFDKNTQNKYRNEMIKDFENQSNCLFLI